MTYQAGSKAFPLLLLALHASLDAQPSPCLTAIDAHRQGNFDTALPAYAACLLAEPQNFQARSNFGAALAHEGRYSEAIEQDRAALTIAPAQAVLPLRMNLALAYYKSSQISAATAEFESILAADANNRKAAVLLADCRLHAGQPKSAINILLPLAAATPDDRALIYLLGSAYLQAGDAASAQSYLDRILRDGESGEGHLLLGTAMMQAQNYPAAVKEFAQAASLSPALPSVHSFHGQALLRTGDPDGASLAFRRELAHQPADFEANLQLGQILLARKRFEEARPFLERAVQLRPHSEEIHASMAELERLTGHAEAALRERKLGGAVVSASPSLASDGPPVGSAAPEFALPQLGSHTVVSLKELRSPKPVLLIFGSYTCPQLRAASSVLNSLYPRFGKQVTFVLVYIKEAHGTGNWQSTINTREGIDLPLATTRAEKEAAAALCVRKLHIPYQAVVDTFDGQTEKVYAAWPSRVYLVDRNGIIRFQTRLSELEFNSDALAEALGVASASLAERPLRALPSHTARH